MARSRRRPITGPLITVGAGLAVLGVGLAVGAHLRRNVRHDLPVPRLLDGRVRWVGASAGRIAVYEGGHASQATPLLLVHDAGISSGSHELRGLWEAFADRALFAMDLPGYGLSERSSDDYSSDDFVNAIAAVSRAVSPRMPLDVLAVGRAADFAALACEQMPQAFRSAVFVAPVGLNGARGPRERLLQLLGFTPLGQMLYDLLSSRPVTRLRMRLGGAHDIAEDDVDRAYLTSHSPLANRAPAHALAGALAVHDAEARYRDLKTPRMFVLGEHSARIANLSGRATVLVDANLGRALATPTLGPASIAAIRKFLVSDRTSR